MDRVIPIYMYYPKTVFAQERGGGGGGIILKVTITKALDILYLLATAFFTASIVKAIEINSANISSEDLK